MSYQLPEQPKKVKRGESKLVPVPWILVEAAQPLMRKDEKMWQFWWRVITTGLKAEIESRRSTA